MLGTRWGVGGGGGGGGFHALIHHHTSAVVARPVRITNNHSSVTMHYGRMDGSSAVFNFMRRPQHEVESDSGHFSDSSLETVRRVPRDMWD